MTGWFIYRCGAGVLLVPAPRCVGPECKGSDGRGTRNLGFAGDIAAGNDGSFRGARSAQALFAASGVEVAQAGAQLGALRDAGEISTNYWKAASNALEKSPDRYIPTIAPGVRRELLGQALAPWALAADSNLAARSDVGVDVADGCRCTPRPFDAVDPVSGWGIYYVNGGVLLTPTQKCIAGGGSIPGWLAMTWRNVLTLFGAAPQNTVQPPPPVLVQAAPLAPGEPAPPPQPAPCVPDIIVGRDEGMFASGWWIVLRDGQRILVANPATCP